MTSSHITTVSSAYDFPAATEPKWSAQVDRWYQLDAYAYGLAEFFYQNREKLRPYPDLLILASPDASNDTDAQFAQTGASSPAKFVHTLPNIRASSLCQVMAWNGPMLCIQCGERTVDAAHDEAQWLLSEYPVIWVVTALNTYTRNIPPKSRVIVECTMVQSHPVSSAQRREKRDL